MIGFLRGQVVSQIGLSEEGLTLDVNGVGYELTCSTNTLDDVASLRAAVDEIHLWVHTHVREDALTLFGFSTALERNMFNSLLKVNGVGPKMAIKILSGARLSGLVEMIDAGDVGALSKLPKVGKKTAEQLILTLKGKLVMNEGAGKLSSQVLSSKGRETKPEQTRALNRFDEPRAAVLSALLHLGFRFVDAERVVGDLPEGVELEVGVRQGLQALSGTF